MSLLFCPTCDTLIDTDFNAEHFDSCRTDMKVYTINVSWTTISEMPVLANSPEEAEAKAKEMLEYITPTFVDDFPDTSDYVTGFCDEASEVYRKIADINEAELIANTHD